MTTYLDSSAVLKLVVAETESDALGDFLDLAAENGQRLVASMLLFTELHCAIQRRGQSDMALVREILARITLADITRGDLTRAANSQWGLRSADAIHLAVALRLEAETIVAYDAELLLAAQRVGLPVVSPGR